MFRYLYTFVLAVAYLAAVPFLLPLGLKKRYKRSLWARFFPVFNERFKEPSIHFHACSLGETKALKPLIERFERVNLSVITQTGYEAAKEYKNAEVRYLPFEIFLYRWLIPQKALVVMEAELWYLLFFLSKRKGAVTFLINARISDRSFSSYKRFSFLYRRVFENVDYVFAQSELDAARLRELGAKRVEVVGNIKLLSKPSVKGLYEKPARKVLVAASTHDPEEEMILDAWLKSGTDYMLVVVPRHPERFEEVDLLLKETAERESLKYCKISESGALKADIVLVDKMGVLNEIYSVADRVILGGSFVPVGGHNPLEPAFFKVPIISGKEIFNQKESYSYVKNIYLIEPRRLSEYIKAELVPAEIRAEANIGPLVDRIEDVVYGR